MAKTHDKTRKKQRTRKTKPSNATAQPPPISSETSTDVPMETPADPISRRNEAIGYLTEWKHNRSSWKFKKIIQLFILTNITDADVFGKSEFAIACEYLKELKGQARTRLVESCLALLVEKKKKASETIDAESKNNDEEKKQEKVDDEKVKVDEETVKKQEKREKTKYKRAKTLVKLLRGKN